MMKKAAIGTLFLATWVHAVRAEDPGWPREYTGEKGGKLVLYQPQISSWKDFKKLEARMAVTILVPGEEEELIGAITLTARTKTDHQLRTVEISGLKITKSSFPALDSAKTKKANAIIELVFPKEPVEISLDRVIANMDRAQLQVRETKVSTEPPRIRVALEETVLVTLDGEAVLEKIDETGLMLVVNTESALFLHPETKSYFLLDEHSWLKSAGLGGPWTDAGELPAAFDSLPKEFEEVRKHVPGMPLKADEVPKVVVATDPTELIVIYGQPVLEQVPGTELAYIENTESDLFLHGDGTYYLLVAGRWFRSASLAGPWTYATEQLPADFQRIPEDHTCGRVLASVPGTEQAEEATISNHMPRTGRVDRKSATVDVTYEGDPEFERIEGTAVSYATNTAFDVFEVGGKYYCCYEAVWFAAGSPTGPWAVCDSVPKEIYEIPSTHPKYNDTYCYVYDSDDDYVYVGYLPGYWGCYYHGGVIVYGCGWRWRWHRRYWRARYLYWRHHPRPVHYTHRHSVYGHGRYYDHLSGRYRRSQAARSHQLQRNHPGAGSYGRWKGNAVRPATVQRKAPAQPAHVAKGRSDLHVGNQGNIYRNRNGNWQRYDESGKWQGTQRPQAKPAARPAPRQELSRSTRARQYGARRSSQYRSYRSSRGTRAASYRGRSRGGGARRGGGRR